MALGLSSSCGTLSAVSSGLTMVAAICHIAAFGSNRWIVSTQQSPFVSIGFHEACFDNCQDPYCPASGSLQVVYNKCAGFWINWEYFEEISHWLLKDWLIMCRNLAAVNFPLVVISLIMLVVATSLAFKGRYLLGQSEKRAKCLQILLFVIAFFLLVAAILCMVVMAVFYTNGFQRRWMPMPEKNAFGFSFWLEFVACITLVVSFVCVMYAAVLKTLWIYGDKDPRYSEDMMLGTSVTSIGPPTQLGQAMAALSHQTV